MGTLEWIVITIVAICVNVAIGLYIREQIWMKKQQSKIDEVYGWLRNYHKRDEDGPGPRG